MQPTRIPIPATPSVTDPVTVTLDGGKPIPGQLTKHLEVGAFGYVIQWTVTIPGTIGNAYAVPPQHFVLTVALPDGTTVHGGGIITALSHSDGQTTILGEGPLSDCPHTDTERVEWTTPTGKLRRLEVCRGCDRWADIDKTPDRAIQSH